VKPDSQLRQDVQEELGGEPSVDERRVGVAVGDGVVTLTGEIGSYAEKWNAERAVERVSGVRGIANDIEVRPAGVHSDAEIAEAAAQALRLNTLVPSDRITPEVENAWIRLVGEVDHNYERREAERSVRNLAGAKGVTNLVTIEPQTRPQDIKAEIKRTFHRRAALDANQVSVEVSGDVVTLRGEVQSWVERREAEEAARAIPGVSDVRNLITTNPPD
jgi:osmotically-inducible protein OsmY